MSQPDSPPAAQSAGDFTQSFASVPEALDQVTAFNQKLDQLESDLKALDEIKVQLTSNRNTSELNAKFNSRLAKFHTVSKSLTESLGQLFDQLEKSTNEKAKKNDPSIWPRRFLAYSVILRFKKHVNYV